MAEGGDADWELCKENIQPLRGGRAIAALSQALSLQEEGSSSATNQHQQAFESELRLYDGEDPLDVWDRYVKWTEQTFPQGGKEGNLSLLLERAVLRFTDNNKYHNDVRYIDLWIKFAENCPEPLDVYRYMQAQGIGTMQACFYIAWSEEHEKQANYRQADEVYQEGFRCHAEPLDRLRQFHKGLQARVSRQVMTGMLEEEEEDVDSLKEQERMSLVDLKHRGKKKAVAPINRVAAAVSCKSSRLLSQGEPAAGSSSNTCFRVFDENRATSTAPAEPRPEAWMAPPTSRAKENEQRPEKWSSIKMPQRSRFGHVVVAPPSVAPPTFQPFVEESDQPPAMTPCKINPAVNSVLSARKPCRGETPLKRLQEHSQLQHAADTAQEQSMYCKELLLSGATEFCFEELRAERYRQRAGGEPGEREGGMEGGMRREGGRAEEGGRDEEREREG